MLYFEDFQPGQLTEYGARTVTREEIVAFAASYDPQPMHLDEAAASRTLLGGLAASGWHTACLLMRLNVDHMLCNAASMGAPGISELRWLQPVRPGDTLGVRSRELAARPSASRPDMGLIEFLFELINQKAEVVMTQQNLIMLGRRERGTA
jgi:acyl dehydratase